MLASPCDISVPAGDLARDAVDIHALPEEILAYILQFLPHVYLTDAAAVSRHWRAVVQCHFRKVRLTDEAEVVDDAFIIRLAQLLQPAALALNGCTEVSEHGFRSLLEVCPDLRALSVTDASLSSVAFRTICRFRCLEEIEFADSHVTEVDLVGAPDTGRYQLTCADKLRKVWLKVVLSNTSITRLWDVSTFTNLTHLDISSPTARNLHDLASCKALRTLVLRDARPQFARDFANTYHSLDFLAHLTSLELHNVFVYTDHTSSAWGSPWAALESILAACTSLQQLTLADMHEVDVCDQVLCAWMAARPGLEMLSLSASRPTHLTDRALTAIANANRATLRSLHSGVQFLAQRCTGLLSVAFPWCSQLTDVAIAALGIHCRSLRHVDVSGCTLISASGLRFLTAAVSLEVLRMYGVHRAADAVPYAQSRGVRVRYRPLPASGAAGRQKSLSLSSGPETWPGLACGCTVIACPYGCGVQMSACELEVHDPVCAVQARPRCPNAVYGCAVSLRREEVPAHLAHCSAYAVQCLYRKCGRAIPRSQVGAHMEQHNIRDQRLPARQCPLFMHTGCAYVGRTLSHVLRHMQACREHAVAADSGLGGRHRHNAAGSKWSYGVRDQDVAFRRNPNPKETSASPPSARWFLEDPPPPMPLFRRRLQMRA